MTLSFEWIVKDCTPEQRDKMAWHLAMFRAKRIYEALRHAPKSDASPTAGTTSATAAMPSSLRSHRTRKRTATSETRT